MTDLLAAAQAPLLTRLARSRTLLAFDFDGTLAPIVADREHAAMRDRTQRLLAELCARYPCAVISGRSRGDVVARLGGVAVPHVIGNHGVDTAADRAPFARIVRRVRPLLAQALAPWSELDLENKGLSLAVHYRRAADRRRARAVIRRAVAALPVPLRAVPGKLVINLVPPHAPHKGHALLALQARLAAETALYVGDDWTDEDVFRLPHGGRLVGVRVGHRRTSAAAHFVRTQQAVDTLLFQLLTLRPGAPLP